MRRTVQDVMTKDVVVVPGTAPFKEVVRLLNEHRVSALPVIDDDGRLIGIVSEGDLLLKEEYAPRDEEERHLFERRRHRLERAKAEGVLARDVMTTPVYTVRRDETLAAAAHLMHEHAVKRLPVVDAEGRAEGIVSRADVLKVFLRPDAEIEDEVVRDVIERTMWIEPSTIGVRVRSGVVRLQGQLELESHIAILIGLVRGVDGVVGVENRLSAQVDDTALRASMLAPWGSYVTK